MAMANYQKEMAHSLISSLSIDWKDENRRFILGFREQGFLPEALLNFMALLGWNSGTEKEIFSLDELIQYFSKDKIGKSSSRFDYDKAKWFNQQYIQNTEDTILAKYVIQDAAKQDQNLQMNKRYQ